MKCMHCNQEVESLNFCPHCGSALSDKAKELEASKITNARLEVLLKVSQVTNDEKTLLAIKDLITKLKQNKKED